MGNLKSRTKKKKKNEKNYSVRFEVCLGGGCLQSTFIGQSHSPVFGLKNRSSSHALTECVPPSHMWYTQQSVLSGKNPSDAHLK
jgi:hypothetical protein